MKRFNNFAYILIILTCLIPNTLMSNQEYNKSMIIPDDIIGNWYILSSDKPGDIQYVLTFNTDGTVVGDINILFSLNEVKWLKNYEGIVCSPYSIIVYNPKFDIDYCRKNKIYYIITFDKTLNKQQKDIPEIYKSHMPPLTIISIKSITGKTNVSKNYFCLNEQNIDIINTLNKESVETAETTNEEFVSNEQGGECLLGDCAKWTERKCVAGNCTNGQGTMIWSDGMFERKYVGQWKDGKFHGKGRLTEPIDYKYVGQFKNGKRHGEGTFTYSDGNSYVGAWENGQRNGYGTQINTRFTFGPGSKYIGYWKNGEHHGQGTCIWDYGDKYVGQWKNGMMHGKGKYTYADGDVNVGRWENDEFVGE